MRQVGWACRSFTLFHSLLIRRVLNFVIDTLHIGRMVNTTEINGTKQIRKKGHETTQRRSGILAKAFWYFCSSFFMESLYDRNKIYYIYCRRKRFCSTYTRIFFFAPRFAVFLSLT